MTVNSSYSMLIGDTYPFEVSMQNTNAMEIFETTGDIDKLKAGIKVQHKMTIACAHKFKAVGFRIRPQVFSYVVILHPLAYHTERK